MNHNNKSNKLTSFKLTELTTLCQSVNYVRPTKNLEDWTSDDYYFDCIYIGIQNPTQMQCCYILCDALPPLKLFAKDWLRRYIVKFSINNEDA